MEREVESVVRSKPDSMDSDRERIEMRKKQKQKIEISVEEIAKALKKFQEKGGLITKLPDEIAPRHAMVGAKWGMFEVVKDTSGVIS